MTYSLLLYSFVYWKRCRSMRFFRWSCREFFVFRTSLWCRRSNTRSFPHWNTRVGHPGYIPQRSSPHAWAESTCLKWGSFDVYGSGIDHITGTDEHEKIHPAEGSSGFTSSITPHSLRGTEGWGHPSMVMVPSRFRVKGSYDDCNIDAIYAFTYASKSRMSRPVTENHMIITIWKQQLPLITADYWLQEGAHTPNQPKNPPPQTACFRNNQWIIHERKKAVQSFHISSRIQQVALTMHRPPFNSTPTYNWELCRTPIFLQIIHRWPPPGRSRRGDRTEFFGWVIRNKVAWEILN